MAARDFLELLLNVLYLVLNLFLNVLCLVLNVLYAVLDLVLDLILLFDGNVLRLFSLIREVGSDVLGLILLLLNLSSGHRDGLDRAPVVAVVGRRGNTFKAEAQDKQNGLSAMGSRCVLFET